MRLITPKRLKENEDFMWRLADRQLDTFVDRGSCEFINDFASPFAMLVIADLLGVPEDDHARFEEMLLHRPEGGAIGTTESMAHSPLEHLYREFTAYIEDRRASPREDVLTGLANATFPDGSTPEVIDAVRVAANLFAAGQETTVRLLGSAVQLIAEDAELQQQLRDNRELIPNFIEESLRTESPIKGDFRLSRVPTSVGGVDLPPGTTVFVMTDAGSRDPRQFDNPGEFRLDRPNGRQHLAFGHGIHTCAGAPLARAETHATLVRFLDRMADIRVSEAHHGPPEARRYEYDPTYMLRGLRELHLEFTKAAQRST